MSRGLTTALGNALTSSSFRPILLVEIDFGGSFLRLSDQDRDITWNSVTWLGDGLLRAPRGMNESSDLKQTGAQIVLSGANSAITSLIFNDAEHSSTVKIYFGCLDSSFAVIADPYEIFSGYVDVPEITDDGTSTSLTINCESDLVILERASELRFTHEMQQQFYPGDKAFEYVPQVALARPFWGKAEKPPKKTRRVAKVTSKKGGSK